MGKPNLPAALVVIIAIGPAVCPRTATKPPLGVFGLGDILKATTGPTNHAAVLRGVDLLKPVRVTHKDGTAFLAVVDGLLAGCVHIVDITVDETKRPKGKDSLVSIEWKNLADT